MQFRKTNSSKVVDHVYGDISKALGENKRVVWLVSGGSTIPLAADILNRLRGSQARLEYLAVMQIDERFGVVGHSDSNWQQLQKAGFSGKDITFLPVLRGKDLQATRLDYQQILEKVLESADCSIGLFGIGADGHTAGILPKSDATKQTDELVIAYETPDFTRITLSEKAIVKLDTVVAYASGSAKEKTLQTLKEQAVSISKQPAQILKMVKDSYVYNDSLEGDI